MAILETVPHFDAARFDRLIAHHGTPAVVRPARMCPCYDETGHPRRLCPHCDGLGIAWGPAMNAMVLLPGRSRRDQYDWMGYQLQGITHMTVQTELTPAHYDLIELTAAEMIVTRERAVWRGAPVRLRMPTVLRVEAVLWLDGITLVDAAPQAVVDGKITLDSSVPTGAQITVRYAARPAYVVISPIEREEGGVRMPYRALVQRLDFWSERSVEVASGGS